LTVDADLLNKTMEIRIFADDAIHRLPVYGGTFTGGDEHLAIEQ